MNPWKVGNAFNTGEVLNVSKVIDTSYSLFNDLDSINLLNNNSQRITKCTTLLGTKNLTDVKSKRLEKEIENSESTWTLVRKKFMARDKSIQELLNMSGLPESDKATLNYLKNGKSVNNTGLWTYLRSNVNNNNFDCKIYIENDFLDFHRNYDAAIEDENKELNKLTHIRYDNLKKSSQSQGQFQYYYLIFVKQIISIKEEKTLKNRFDLLFQTVNVTKALNAMKDITIAPSELKALVYQESGDLTNSTIAGIIDEKAGLRKKGNVNNSYIGIAQIGLLAMKEGEKWAKLNGIQFINKTEKDLRKDPENAVILLTCILASNYELYLSKSIIYNGTDCSNWKKCIIGSYNWSGPSMMNLIKKYNTINWDILSSKIEMPTQTKNYVSEITSRL